MSRRQPNTVLFWGAGATASLRMCTTEEQGRILLALSRKNDSSSYGDCLNSFKYVFGAHFETVCDLLTLLDDSPTSEGLSVGYRMSGFSAQQLALMRKYGADFGRTDDERRNRLTMMRMRYDWAAVMRILKSNRYDVEIKDGGEKPSATFVQDVYSLIDANVSAGTGIHIFDDDAGSSRSDFIDIVRLRAAKSALIMFHNLMFAASWNSLGDSDKLDGYKNFFRLLADYRAEEFKETQSPTSHIRVVSMNFDPIFWWFVKNADEEYNRQPIVVGDAHSPLFLGEDLDQVDSVRPMAEGQEARVGDLLRADTAAFVNTHGDREEERCLAKYQTMQMLFPHGSPNIKICHCCGKTTLYQGNKLSWESASLFPPFFMHDIAWGALPTTEVFGRLDSPVSEKVKWDEGERDYIQCRNCGQGIRMCDTEMLVQSGLKAQPSWLLQRIAHDVDAEVMQAQHIILLGYSLPRDDAIWVAELKARCQRSRENVYCSLVNYFTGAPAKWMTWDEVRNFKEANPGLDMRPMEMAKSIFGEKYLRVHLQGFPAMAQDKESIIDLFGVK